MRVAVTGFNDTIVLGDRDGHSWYYFVRGLPDWRLVEMRVIHSSYTTSIISQQL
jgi:hypothetical protein